MSGIINSAGSRSGVIGITELDYEESSGTINMFDASTGTSVPLGPTVDGTRTNPAGTYIMTKIGNVAHIKIACTISSTATSNAAYVVLPIANSTGKLVGCSGNQLSGSEEGGLIANCSLIIPSSTSRGRINSYSGDNLYIATLYFNFEVTFVGLT